MFIYCQTFKTIKIAPAILQYPSIPSLPFPSLLFSYYL